MTTNLAKIINLDNAEKLLSATLKFNKKTGAAIAQAVWSGGRSAIKIVTHEGIKIAATIDIPKITSVPQRNNLIKDLLKQGFTQDQTASILNLSQSTISRVSRSFTKK